VSCEHGGNRVPGFTHLLSKRFLHTHRGYDPGALELARDVAKAAGAPFFHSTVSRLLVELNRPLGHPHLFYLDLSQAQRDMLLRRYYLPYWRAVEAAIRKAGRRVLHLSVHSFTPRFRGVTRSTDIGLLFDPQRPGEAAFCRAWARELAGQNLRVHENRPYAGVHPSVVQSMRERFSPGRYAGIQIEINQRYPRRGGRRWRALRRALVESFSRARARAARRR
jgi:predicted N-formylglutamate amidohydrolase